MEDELTPQFQCEVCKYWFDEEEEREPHKCGHCTNTETEE